jgi:hypothetical protein
MPTDRATSGLAVIAVGALAAVAFNGSAEPAGAVLELPKTAGTIQVKKAKLIEERRVPGVSRNVNSQEGLPSLAIRQTVAGELGQGDVELADGSWIDIYTLQGTVGTTLTISLRSDQFDALLVVLDTYGNELATSDDVDGTNSRLTLRIPRTGTYVVGVNSFGSGEAGAYSLSVGEGRPGTRFQGPVASASGAPNERYALLVGIGDYPGRSADLPVGPTQDVDAFYELLVDRFGFRPENILVLKDSAGTRGSIVQAIRLHLGQAGEEGMALLYYSGHGRRTSRNEGLTGDDDIEPDNRDEALQAYDGLLIDDEIGKLVGDLTAGRVVLVFDSCHSGRGSRAAGLFPKRLDDAEAEALAKLQPGGDEVDWLEEADIESPLFDGPPSDSEWLREPRDHILLAASLEDKVAWAMGELGMSAFTFFLVRELGRRADDDGLGDAFSAVVRNTDNRVPEPQTPQLEGVDQDRSIGYFFGNER